MKQSVFVALAAALVLTLGAAPRPARPVDGTYVYAISGTPALTESTVVVRGTAGGLSTVETVVVAGQRVVAQTAYDATLVPVRYAAEQHGTTQQIAIPAGSEAVGDNLVAYAAMLPSLFAARGRATISLYAITAGKTMTMTASPGTDARPADIPAADSETVVTESAGVRFAIWSNPQTHATDGIDVAGLRIRLTGYSPGTAVATPAPVPTAYPTAPPRYADRAVTFASTSARLAGTLSVPRGPAGRRYPAFVFVHGSGPGTRDGGLPTNPTFRLLGNALANAGYAVLRYDKRGIGASTGTPTEHWRPLADDAAAAVAYLRAQPDVDPRRIFVLGHSEGGLIVPLVAPEIRPRLAGIVLMAGPAIPMPRVLDEQMDRMTPALRARLDAAFADYADVDPKAVIAKVPVPVLVLQGTRDIQILARDLPPMIAAARAAKRDVTVRVLDGDNHLFMRLAPAVRGDGAEYFVPAPLDPRLARAILDWAARLR